jgi:16S rRNA C967 or C1407 C5-methylase (RsmB/RsmF family)
VKKRTVKQVTRMRAAAFVTNRSVDARATSPRKQREKKKKGSDPPPPRSRRSDDDVYSSFLGWESCARRILIGLEHIVRADRARKPIDAQKVVKKCLRAHLSPSLQKHAREWEEKQLNNEERKVIAGTILTMEVKKRELLWHLEGVLDTREEKGTKYLKREMWERLKLKYPNQRVEVEDALTVEETAMALLTLYEAKIQRSNIVDTLSAIVVVDPSRLTIGENVLNERAMSTEFPLAHVPEIKTAEVLAKWLSVQDWAAHKLVEQYGATFTEELLEHLNRKGPISLRANLIVNDGEEFRELSNIVERDEEAAVTLFHKVPFESEEDSLLAFTVSDTYRISPERDPDWLDGRYEIQDIGSQFIASSCRAGKNDQILDFCCGNGGKTLALAAKGAFVTAHDVDQRRMKHLEANAKRARVSHLITTVSDANDLKANGCYYDSVLVDAPCSSAGAWRRTPSSRWLAKEEDVGMFSKLQLEILLRAASIQLENRNGSAKTTTMVYATCSIFKEENEDVARAFEASDVFKEMGYEPWPFVKESEGEDANINFAARAYSMPSVLAHEMQLFPNLHETDGFYLCRWRSK